MDAKVDTALVCNLLTPLQTFLDEYAADSARYLNDDNYVDALTDAKLACSKIKDLMKRAQAK
jgi:hypothetical protein